ncbi:MAG TPA: DNA/RNA non-specific endonuclease [Bryobacteraceae bacterium]|nr:DNA/RNA non-specific endonuclease [Bryobacteraceae bacterium]
MKARHIALVVAAALVVLAGCGHSALRTRAARYSVRTVREAGLSPDDQKRADRNCVFGMPRINPKWDFGPTRFVFRDGYVLQHSSIDKVPLWVCEDVTTQQLTGAAKRGNKFAPDPLLPPKERAELADYKGSGYDRGHQAPAGNQAQDQRLKDETFFLSNMAPQKPKLNQQAWRELEDLTRKWTEKRGQTWQITGGMFYDPAEEDEKTADGLIEYTTIGKDNVGVPTHFYKIVAGKGPSGDWEAIAFVMENKAYPRPFHFEQFIQSIDWIEERTGLDFMPDLDPVEERRLERKPSPMWQ